MGDRAVGEVLAEHRRRLMAIPGVLGVAESVQTDGRPCILVLFEGPLAAVTMCMPRSLGGYPLIFHATDGLEAHPERED